MSAVPTRRKVIGDARLAAQTLHAQLGTDFDRPVDIFEIVQRLQIWLTTRPLGGLYGFYLKEGDAVGIVLNEAHPEYLQRYTCAHELGHHVLGHASHLDEEEQIESGTPDGLWDELAAQAFAGAFLMPLQALNRVQRRLGVARNRPVAAAEVYLISRELDVSFSAAAWQLVTHNRLDARAAREYVRRGAAAAKNAIRPGPPPMGDNRAGLAILGPAQSGLPLLCRAGDELRVRLPENASTGYVWRLVGTRRATVPGPEWDGGTLLVEAADRSAVGDSVGEEEPETAETPVRLLEDQYLQPTDPDTALDTVVGSTGMRELVFVAQTPGSQDLRVRFGRPWEAEPDEEFTTRVRVAPRHSVSGFTEDQRRSHAARLIGA